jgi:serine protease SohB
VFVLTFNGDVMASQVHRMREEITAILNIADAKRGDRVILQLNSPGGTVTGYGLAAAQLLRIKDAGLPLTVSVDEVAASGGYLMACVADEIVASPFAMFGSIGVVATIPNFADRLQREGVVVEDVTAGKYKRTMTAYKKPTEEDRAKVKSDVEQILLLFKDFVKKNRPHLADKMDQIATGEVWHAGEAKEKGLIDGLTTTDDLLLQYYHKGYEVFSLQMRPYIPRFGEENDPFSFSMEGDDSSSWTAAVTGYAKSFFYSVFSSVLKDFLNASPSSLNNNTGTQYPRIMTTENGYEHSDSTQSVPLHHRFLAIDPSHQYPPKM